MKAEQITLPQEGEAVSQTIKAILQQVDRSKLSDTENALLEASMRSYAFYWNHYFSKDHDPSQLIGQDNFLRYVPRKHLIFRLQPEDAFLDVIRLIIAAVTCGCRLELSLDSRDLSTIQQTAQLQAMPGFVILQESETKLIERILGGEVDRIRLLTEPSKELLEALSSKAVNIHIEPVLANGRLELLNFLREVSLCIDYHRYGNLGAREDEPRTSPASTDSPPCQERCGSCSCQ